MPSSPNDPVPEVRVAAKVATYFRFNEAIDRASVELEGAPTRFRWVDTGDRLVAIEPLLDLATEEKLAMRVRYKDGASPTYGTFALVSHPTLVDKEVEVVHRPRTVEGLEAALAEKEAQLAALEAVRGPSGLVFSGRIDLDGVRARRLELVPVIQDGLAVVDGQGYRASSWTLAVVRVRNLPGQQPWKPRAARLTLPDGTSVKVRSVDMDKARLAPGEEGLVAVETEAAFWKVGETLRLELLDESGGQRLSLPKVKL